MSHALTRIAAILLRHYYLLIGSWPRVVNMIAWPTVNILIWGFMSTYLKNSGMGVAAIVGTLLGGLLLWEMFNRSQVATMIGFMEEVWARNVGQLFVTPLKVKEYMCALLVFSAIHGVVSLVPAVLIAQFMFGFSLLSIGLPLALFFFALLIFGWAIGMIIISLILRYGLAAEWFSWLLPFTIAPLMAIYYPVSALPQALQPISWALGPTWVFEGMRAVLAGEGLRWDLLAGALALNGVALLLAIGVFILALRNARQRGALLHMAE